MKLSRRLNAIIDMTEKCRCLADIGTDHAFVPIEAVKRGKAEQAIAADVRKGPLKIAEGNIQENGLSDRIRTRLSDGLKEFKPKEADQILIAGMGGLLIRRILEEGKGVIETCDTLVVSPHTDVTAVREWIVMNGLTFKDEEMVEEEGKFYTIIKAVQERSDSSVKTDPVSEEELEYGPVLLKKRTPVFMAYLKRQERITKELIEKLKSQEQNERVEALIKENEIRLDNVKKILSGAGNV